MGLFLGLINIAFCGESAISYAIEETLLQNKTLLKDTQWQQEVNQIDTEFFIAAI